MRAHQLDNERVSARESNVEMKVAIEREQRCLKAKDTRHAKDRRTASRKREFTY